MSRPFLSFTQVIEFRCVKEVTIVLYPVIRLRRAERDKGKSHSNHFQNLFSGGANTASYDSSGKQIDLAELGLATTENSILLEGLIAYFSLRGINLFDLARERRLLQKQLKLENEKAEKGKELPWTFSRQKGVYSSPLSVGSNSRTMDVSTTILIYSFSPGFASGAKTISRCPRYRHHSMKPQNCSKTVQLLPRRKRLRTSQNRNK